MTTEGDHSKPLVEIEFQPDNITVNVPSGTPIAKAATIAGCSVETPCGGLGVCGKCRIRVLSGAGSPDKDELRLLTADEINSGVRLACKTRASGKRMVIDIPPESRSLVQQILSSGVLRRVEPRPNVWKIHVRAPTPNLQDERAEYERIVAECARSVSHPPSVDLLIDFSAKLRSSAYDVTAVVIGDRLADIEQGDTTDNCYGIAYDLGSTTVVGYLIHLPTSREVAVAATMNPQVAHGDDLVSRIRFASTAEGRVVLRQAAVRALNDVLLRATQKAKISPSSLYEATVVGNTCMTHLLLGIDPSSLGVSPYVPTIRGALDVPPSKIGLRINQRGNVHVLPNVAGFVGSDLVGVLLASMWEDDGHTRLAVDIGTNGEMALRHHGKTLACSAAAGPAFEGAGISCGMRGSPGAIDSVGIGEDVRISTIRNQKPKGICGSGLLDAIAWMLRVGVIEETGRMPPADEIPALPNVILQRIVEDDGQRRFVLAWPEESATGAAISITQRDVRHVQLAKGSIHAAIRTLLSLAGAAPEDIDEILLAGAFGNYIQVESALRIGLIPAISPDRVKSVGNAAGSGARLSLLSVEERKRAAQIAERVEHIELANHPTYQQAFEEQMLFPERERESSLDFTQISSCKSGGREGIPRQVV